MADDIFKELEKKARGGGGGGKFLPILIVIVVVIMVLPLVFGVSPTELNPAIKVNSGERGVVLTWGAAQEKELEPGLHFIIPIMQQVKIMDVTIQKSETEAAASSSDIQQTHSVIALNYQVDPEHASDVYNTLRYEYKNRIIDPTVQEVVKAVTARFTAPELIAQRDQVRTEIKEHLKVRLAENNIIVNDFAIIDFSFSEQFSKAIEEKQTAEQFALKAQRDLERIKIEAEQKIAQAKAEAESLRLQKENISKDLIELRKIEAQIKAIDKWDGTLPRITGGAMPFIDVKSYDQQ